jgi:hypothetical protein
MYGLPIMMSHQPLVRYGTSIFAQLLVAVPLFWIAGSQAQPPTVIVDRDGDVIRVVEGRRAAIKGGVVEIPIGLGLRVKVPGERMVGNDVRRLDSKLWRFG